jgi:hypothetical protein
VTGEGGHHGPVAIGGVGGSGTRVGAALLRQLGYYLGADRNAALDNLWFTLLFKDPAILELDDVGFEARSRIFWARMSGARSLTKDERRLVAGLAAEARFEHTRAWLARRARSLLAGRLWRAGARRWGWKEPNTALVSGRLLRFDPRLRYIHFVRHPLDMALSANQNQPLNWGAALLGTEAEVTPRRSLAFWCASHRRTAEALDRHPDRTMAVDFDALCAQPAAVAGVIAGFLGRELPRAVASNFERMVRAGAPQSDRRRGIDLGQFDPGDIAYVAGLGYDLSTTGRSA